jgi:hypothetical protein
VNELRAERDEDVAEELFLLRSAARRLLAAADRFDHTLSSSCDSDERDEMRLAATYVHRLV